MDMYLEQMKHIFIGWSTLKYDIVSVETAGIFLFPFSLQKWVKTEENLKYKKRNKKWLNMKHILWKSNFKMKN